ncbi:amino acid/polyamine transporter I [Gautieria morchelliformis]|nr:amino acid/polyamine transporter I [Gautieria morchelliformis]
MLWILGFLLSTGLMFPRSNGEKVYLEAVYKRPKYLATLIFASQAIFLGFTASGCIVFAQNILISAGQPAERWVVRGIALGVITFATLIHGLTPHAGVWLMNALSFFKTFILVFIVVTGWAVLAGHTRVKDPHANFRNSFAGSSQSSNDYATATFKVLNAYAGWSNVNYVLNEVKNPVRTLKIAGPLGLGICATLYVLANVSYFAAATKQQITKSGVTVASLFFGNVFGTHAQKALTVFIALRCVREQIFLELAKEGIPLPFGNRFWASTWPGKAPLPGLIIHLIPSVVVILGPPPNIVYPFILDIEGYPQQVVNLFIILGLFYLRWTKPNAHRPFKVWWPIAVFFLAAAVFLIIAPFLPPSNRVGDTPPLPYWLYCIVALGVLFAGVAYWFVWRVVLPKVFGYALVPRKEKLADGTVVTVFSREKIQ